MPPIDVKCAGAARNSENAGAADPVLYENQNGSDNRDRRGDEHADLQQPSDHLLDRVVARARRPGRCMSECSYAPRHAFVQHLRRAHDTRRR